MKLGSLCTGYGGLDMAAHAMFPDADLAFVSDNDKHVSRFLDARFPDVPNLGDFTQLDHLPGCDILTAGFPCQPVSSAGKRKGVDDDRWLWDDIERLLGAMVRPPGLLLLENVRGLLSANGGDAMARVVEGLAGLGYMGRYRVLAASDIGAPHRRQRVFIVARHAKGGRRDGSPATHMVHEEPTRSAGRPSGATAADADLAGYETWGDAGCERERVRLQPVGHPASAQFGPYAAAVARWEQILGRPAPEPTVASNPSRNGAGDETADGTGMGLRESDADGPVPGRVSRAGRRLNPRFVEWMMGLPDGWVTDPDLGLSRTTQLKMLGNGVVPQQAYAAYRGLL